MGRFGIHILLEDNTWSTRYRIPKNDRYKNSTTNWTVVSFEIYGVKTIYDQRDSSHADMCFKNFTITHSAY